MAQGLNTKLQQPRGLQRTRELEQRNVDMWTDYVGGYRLDQLGLKYDMTPQNCAKILRKMRESKNATQMDADAMRQRLVDQALNVMQTLTDMMHAAPIPAYSNGKPILDEDGNQALDHTNRLNAARTLLLANKRLAELTGADAAQQIDITVTQQAQQSAQEAASAALARVFATVTDVPAIEAQRADLVIEAETLLAQEDTAL